MKSNLSVVISAPSGAGKTTIISKIIPQNPELAFAISTTTRKKRENEVEGESYYFTTEEDFKHRVVAGEFAEWAQVHSNYYGTSKKEIDRIKSNGRIPLFDVDVQGAYNLKKTLADAVYIFIIPPSVESLRERLTGRGTDSPDQIKLRLQNSLIECEQYAGYDYIVVNDDLERAAEDVKSIIRSELLKRDRMKEKIEVLLEEYSDNPTR